MFARCKSLALLMVISAVSLLGCNRGEEGGRQTTSREQADLVKELRSELARLIEDFSDGKADKMPLDEGIKTEVPDPKIR